MARNVIAKRVFEIHQALHGYSDGHRQLAISTKLEPSDSKLLLTFSDISGPGAKSGTDGYLTGYPLSTSGFFALSRTWLAPDMPRPGCVWTHTLLISFTDLAVIESPEKLNRHFRCPLNRRDVEQYTRTLEFALDEPPTIPVYASKWEAGILQALYGHPDKHVLVERPSHLPDELVLALWSQQWPRLRRSFSFCSLCTRDRSSNGINFDLQMMPATVSARQSSIVHDANEQVEAQEDWLLRALRDLERPNDMGLRSFLKIVGSDVDGGRAAFKPLCTLFVALEEEHAEAGTLGRALVTLESEPSLSGARTARAVVANMLTKNVERLDDVELCFLWKNIEYVDRDLLSKQGTNVLRTVWRRAPDAFNELSTQTEVQQNLIDRTVQTVELSELLGHIAHVRELERLALRLRPGIVKEVAFWRSAAELEDAVEAAAVSQSRNESIEAMIWAKRKELAMLAVSHFGERDILSAIARTIGKSDVPRDVRTWIVEATRDATGLKELLRTTEPLHLAFLTLVAGCVSEDSVPNEEGKDPWLIALRRAGALDNEGLLDLELAVFVLSRALGGASSSPGGLLRAGFESVDTALTARRLPEKLWQHLDPYLPRSFFWFDRNRNHRIRTAVTDLFVDRELPAEDFVEITREFDTFRELVRQMSWSRAGRKYLESVIRAAKGKEKKDKNKGEGLTKSKIVETILEDTR